MTRLWALLLCMAAACAPPEVQHRSYAIMLPYGCKDLVVVGRLVTRSGETFTPPDGLLGRSRWQMNVQIKQLLRGAEQRLTVPASGVSHAPPRSDRDFLAVLSPTDSGSYVLKTATLWDERPPPTLVEPCS